MSEAISPSVGRGVLHLFCRPTASIRPDAVVNAVHATVAAGGQVVCVNILGHKADVGFMAMHEDLRELRHLQTALQRAGLDVVDSYVSLTEVSEYAKGMPAERIEERINPQIPPRRVEMNSWCFYPMSKKREAHANWFTLPFDDRSELMHEHGASGRAFAGRVVQYVTGSTGLDDYEWGVTLFAVNPDDLKEVVYTMRFDRASSEYAEFGPFYTGMVTPVEELAGSIG